VAAIQGGQHKLRSIFRAPSKALHRMLSHVLEGLPAVPSGNDSGLLRINNCLCQSHIFVLCAHPDSFPPEARCSSSL
jgi:hypothetical protein